MTKETRDDAIVVTGLRKSYGDIRAVADLDLRVPAGTVFGLLGPNGAGKSTTIRILSTLARPDAGAARVGGHDVVGDPAAVRRTIGVVAQTSGVDPDATARENLTLQGRIHGLDRGRLGSRVVHLLHRFGLDQAADRLVSGYSGGMVRRLDLAMGLIHQPTVLFLDEPTTGLDPEIRATLWHDIEQLCREDGLTILLTTHYLEEADRLAQRLAIVDGGRVVAQGTPKELKRSLSGDSLQVEVPTGTRPDAIHRALGAVPGVAELVLEGTRLSARATDGPRAIPELLSALDREGITASAVTVTRPSLDDVYLSHTGRRLAAADGANDRTGNRSIAEASR